MDHGARLRLVAVDFRPVEIHDERTPVPRTGDVVPLPVVSGDSPRIHAGPPALDGDVGAQAVRGLDVRGVPLRAEASVRLLDERLRVRAAVGAEPPAEGEFRFGAQRGRVRDLDVVVRAVPERVGSRVVHAGDAPLRCPPNGAVVPPCDVCYRPVAAVERPVGHETVPGSDDRERRDGRTGKPVRHAAVTETPGAEALGRYARAVQTAGERTGPERRDAGDLEHRPSCQFEPVFSGRRFCRHTTVRRLPVGITLSG